MIHKKNNHINDLVTMIILCFIFSLSINCTRSIQDNETYQHTLIKENDSLYYLQIKTDSSLDSWKLPYPVYQFQTGDIDEDGSDDMFVGVIKTTRFDAACAKRLFIFKNYQGLVRPLWLGSRMGQPLYDFNFISLNGKPCIRTIELEKNGKYLVAEYKWRSFGLEFIRYIDREIEISNAEKLLKAPNL